MALNTGYELVRRKGFGPIGRLHGHAPMRLLTLLAASGLTALGLTACASTPAPAPTSLSPDCNDPVLMIVSGITIDRDRMIEYSRAIAASRLYEDLGGYYLNLPRAIEEFEGDAPADYTTTVVRFPCLANARAFWNSRAYQEDILPLRQDPSAGDYIVRVYREVPPRADMIGKLGDNAYLADFTDHGVEPRGN